jgi:hypothetical protein
MQNGRRITRRKIITKETTRTATKDVVVGDAAIKEEVVVDAVVKVVVAVDKAEATTNDVGNMTENICGNYAQPISTAQLEKLQELGEAGADATVEEVVAEEDTSRIIPTAIISYLHRRIMEVQSVEVYIHLRYHKYRSTHQKIITMLNMVVLSPHQSHQLKNSICVPMETFTPDAEIRLQRRPQHQEMLTTTVADRHKVCLKVLM